MPVALSHRIQDDIKSALFDNRTAVDIATEFKIHPVTVRRYARKFWASVSRTVVTKIRATFTIPVVYTLLFYDRRRYARMIQVYDSGKRSVSTVLE